MSRSPPSTEGQLEGRASSGELHAMACDQLGPAFEPELEVARERGRGLQHDAPHAAVLDAGQSQIGGAGLR